MFAEVIVDIAHSDVDRVFDYDIAGFGIEPGQRVIVPFGRQTLEGFVMRLKDQTQYDGKVKPIIKIIDDRAVITQEQLALVDYMVDRYNIKIVDALRAFIPAEMRGGRVNELTRLFVSCHQDISLSEALGRVGNRSQVQSELISYLYQEQGPIALSVLGGLFSPSAVKALEKKQLLTIESRRVERVPYKQFSVENTGHRVTLTSAQQSVCKSINESSEGAYLLHGVTGSGKTEVYLNCISACLSEGKSAIMLVPEISLTPQTLRLFRARFGASVAILHSALSQGERYDEWCRLLTGEARIAVGARSAIFAPLDEIGIIIIDEEHDGSYISESSPRYYTHDVAEFRRRYNQCRLVLGSATPSVESYYKSEIGEYKLLELKERVNERPLPHIKMVNMCDELRQGNNGVFSRQLIASLTEEIKQGNQAILFLNRRGYASYQMCRSCGYVVKCDDCDVSMVYHRDEGVLKCHYCSARLAPMEICPSCKSEHIKQGAVGTQRVIQELSQLLPGVKVLRMDNDTTRNKDGHLNIINDFVEKKAQILVGTQMVAKGHDFPDVTFVGIIDADMSLYFSDFRSIEKTFQLITQVAGRAGRAHKAGGVVLQTYAPKHYVYRFAVNNDYLGFYKKEVNIRQVTKYPPFTYLLRIMSIAADEESAIAALKEVYDKIKLVADEVPADFVYLKAMKAPIKKIKSKFRTQILIRLERTNVDIILKRIYNLINSVIRKDVLIYSELNPQDLS